MRPPATHIGLSITNGDTKVKSSVRGHMTNPWPDRDLNPRSLVPEPIPLTSHLTIPEYVTESTRFLFKMGFEGRYHFLEI